MKNTLETRLGIFFAVALIAAVVLLELLGGRDLFTTGTVLRARFGNIQELKVGDPVKMAGVEIGRIQNIELTGGKVEVRMKVSQRAEVHTDSKAAIRFVGLMGQNFVALDFGTATAPIATQDTLLESTDQADLNSLLVKLDQVASGVDGLTKNFSGENFGNLLSPLTDFFKDNKPRMSAILGNVQTMSDQIVQGKGTVGKLINEDALYVSVQEAVRRWSTATDGIKPLVDQANLTLKTVQTTMTGINAGDGSLGKLVKDETLYRETTEALANLREIFQKINKGQGTVGKLINEDTFLKDARMTLQKVDKATEGLEDQGPMSVFGILVNSLF